MYIVSSDIDNGELIVLCTGAVESAIGEKDSYLYNSI
jgi:hypothetical protein